MADKLAKEGAFQLNNNDKNVKLNFSTIKSLIHRNNYEKWVNFISFSCSFQSYLSLVD